MPGKSCAPHATGVSLSIGAIDGKTALDLSTLTPWLGRRRESIDTLTPRLVECYRATLSPHLADLGPENAPLAIHWCLAPEAAPASRLGTDGHPHTGDFLPPVPLPRRMWAGGRVETMAPLKTGDRVLRRSSIARIAPKAGRTGTLCFVTVEHELCTERGVAIHERQDLVYRDAAQGAAPTDAPSATSTAAPPEDCDLVWTIQCSSLLLFRYSAITFNGHRIHYDLPYATGIEGYAGLVVHGPLQASLLLNLAATIGGSTPRVFDYRGLAPLIADEVFLACARRGSDGSLRCWTQARDGAHNMEATASW